MALKAGGGMLKGAAGLAGVGAVGATAAAVATPPMLAGAAVQAGKDAAGLLGAAVHHAGNIYKGATTEWKPSLRHMFGKGSVQRVSPISFDPDHGLRVAGGISRGIVGTALAGATIYGAANLSGNIAKTQSYFDSDTGEAVHPEAMGATGSLAINGTRRI